MISLDEVDEKLDAWLQHVERSLWTELIFLYTCSQGKKLTKASKILKYFEGPAISPYSSHMRSHRRESAAVHEQSCIFARTNAGGPNCFKAANNTRRRQLTLAQRRRHNLGVHISYLIKMTDHHFIIRWTGLKLAK